MRMETCRLLSTLRKNRTDTIAINRFAINRYARRIQSDTIAINRCAINRYSRRIQSDTMCYMYNKIDVQ